jgi:hypothetical protein
MVTLGATCLYAAISGAQPTLASVIEVSVRVTDLPPAAEPLPLSLELLSCVPLPQATSAAPMNATAALETQGRNLVIIGISPPRPIRLPVQRAGPPRRSRPGKALVCASWRG